MLYPCSPMGIATVGIICPMQARCISRQGRTVRKHMYIRTGGIYITAGLYHIQQGHLLKQPHRGGGIG